MFAWIDKIVLYNGQINTELFLFPSGNLWSSISVQILLNRN